MLFKMILDGASEDERPIARSFLRHIVAGFTVGLICGGALFGAMFLTLGNLDLDMPVLFIAAVLLQFGPIGGLIGAGVHVTRITDRGTDASDDDDEPRGGTKAPVTTRVAGTSETRRRPPKASPVPSPA